MFYAGVTIQNQSLDQTIVDVSCIVIDEIAQVGRQYDQCHSDYSYMEISVYHGLCASSSPVLMATVLVNG